MKKNSFNKILCLFSIVLMSIFSTSCSEEFLDEPKNENGLADEVIFSNRAMVESFITGIFRNYRSQYTTVDTGGMYSLFFARSVKGNDLIQSANWYGFDYEHGNREPNYRRTIFNWNFNYENVFNANKLIYGITNSVTIAENDKKELIAIAKTIRAYHYFQLALEFTPNLATNPNATKLPLYTEEIIGSTDPNPPVTTTEIYNFIKADLVDAIADLPDTRLGKSYINKAVASGILANVLLVTQDDWGLCSTSAQYAYGGNSSSAVVSTNWFNGFNDMSDQEWIWAMYQDNVETNYYYAAPHVFTDHFVLSYQATYVNSNFVNKFSATDVRNTFVDYYGVSTPWRKYVTSKFAFSFDADLPLMRKSEMVLVDAEAQFRLGNEVLAKQLLYSLQSERDSNAVMSSNFGTALLDEILLERRKELYAENGVEWFDAKRLRKSIVRDNVHRVILTVPADSELFYLKVPQAEIDRNPFIDSSINNE